MTSFCAPVVVFGYNRPDHLSKTLTALAQADMAAKTRVWVFSDGPRNTDAEVQVIAVRELLLEPKWQEVFAGFTVIEAEQNKGLANSIISGVSQILELHDQVIVLEDDLIVSKDFLCFMNDCLKYYGDDQKVGSITGFCPLTGISPAYAHDVMAVPRNCSHGWATWADRWFEVDWMARDALRVKNDRNLRRTLNSAGSDRLDRLRRQLAGQIDSWSIRFGLWQVLTGRHTIYPVDNRIQNIGFDGSGIHTRVGEAKNSEISDEAIAYKLTSPEISPDILSAFHATYSGSILSRLRRGIRNL